MRYVMLGDQFDSEWKELQERERQIDRDWEEMIARERAADFAHNRRLYDQHSEAYWTFKMWTWRVGILLGIVGVVWLLTLWVLRR